MRTTSSLWSAGTTYTATIRRQSGRAMIGLWGDRAMDLVGKKGRGGRGGLGLGVVTVGGCELGRGIGSLTPLDFRA